MSAVLIVTVTCPDRPGVVERISEVLLGRQANWEESWMGRLGGVFAGIIKVSVAEEEVDFLADDLHGLSSEEMVVMVRPSAAEAVFQDYHAMHLRLSGADHEGIVHSISGFLATRGVNVEKLQTHIANAPWTGGPLFMATADIRCPPSLDIDELRSDLEAMAAEQAVDVTLVDSKKTSQ
jgi:glycine cleavage system regulatory protein